MNGITALQPIANDYEVPLSEHLIDALNFVANGRTPGDGVPPGHDFGCGWQWFDPTEVTDPDALPAPWAEVYALHHDPLRRDCVRMGYRYVHSPEPLRGDYPRCARAGVFCVSRPEPTPTTVRAADLIWIGDEIGEEATR